MDTMVSARVPVEIKSRADLVLKDLGATVTDLVNAAFEYVLRFGALPEAQESDVSETPELKVLDGDAAQRFREEWGARAVLDLPSYDGTNYKSLLDDARSERYARFA